MIIENDVLVSVSGLDVKNGVFKIPDGVTSIGEGALAWCFRFTSVAIPDSVTSIGEYAFWACKKLASVTIGNGVTSIGGSAFYGCRGLTSITIPDSVTSIGNGAFYDCSGLTSITIPDSVTSIGEYAFWACKKLASVTIGNGVTSIGESAFDGCSDLTNAIIGNGVTSIGEYAFNGTNLISSTGNYKAFRLKGDKLFCLKKEYREGVKNRVKGKLKLCKNGIHYCTNLFDIFNYYYGEIDKDIAIYEIEVGDKVLKDYNNSKCCTNSCVLKKRLYRKDIINILNKGATK